MSFITQGGGRSLKDAGNARALRPKLEKGQEPEPGQWKAHLYWKSGDWEMEISVRDECTADLTRESNPVCQVVGKAQNTEARAL